jgi:hypothetical protein
VWCYIDFAPRVGWRQIEPAKSENILLFLYIREEFSSQVKPLITNNAFGLCKEQQKSRKQDFLLAKV